MKTVPIMKAGHEGMTGRRDSVPQGVTIGAKVRFVRIYEFLVKGQK